MHSNWSAPSHPDGQWFIADPSSRLQLRGSGGVSPRFPFVLSAVCEFFSPLKLNSRLNTNALLKTMFDLQELGSVPAPHFLRMHRPFRGWTGNASECSLPGRSSCAGPLTLRDPSGNCALGRRFR